MTAVVPVKPLHLAKSRLDLDPQVRARLAMAFALDTVSTLGAVPGMREVLVVTGDPTAAAALRRTTARLVPEHGTGLRAAVAQGLAEAARRHPDDTRLVVPADLPCLRAVDVVAVLRAAGGSASFVPDRAGRGTTLVVLPPAASAGTAYGPGSARRHRALGLRRVEAPVRARHDVDTVEALETAQQLGTGPRTGEVLAPLGTLDRRAG